MEFVSYFPAPPSARALAAILAASIVGDLEGSAARLLPDPDTIVYGDAADVVATPQETLDRGVGSSADLARLVGATDGDAVGVVGTPGTGFHFFLLKGGKVLDPSVGRGFPTQSADFYAGAATAPIKRPPLFQVGRRTSTGIVMETRGGSRTPAVSPPIVAQPVAAPAMVQAPAIQRSTAVTPAGPANGNPGVVGPTAPNSNPGVTGFSVDLPMPGMVELLAAARAELPDAEYAALYDTAMVLTSLHGQAASGMGIEAAMQALVAEIEKAPPSPESPAAAHLANQERALACLHAILKRPDLSESVAQGADNVMRAALALAMIALGDLPEPAPASDGTPCADAENEVQLFDDAAEPHALPFGGGGNWFGSFGGRGEPPPGCPGACGAI